MKPKNYISGSAQTSEIPFQIEDDKGKVILKVHAPKSLISKPEGLELTEWICRSINEQLRKDSLRINDTAERFLKSQGIKDTLYQGGEWKEGGLSDLLREYNKRETKAASIQSTKEGVNVVFTNGAEMEIKYNE